MKSQTHLLSIIILQLLALTTYEMVLPFKTVTVPQNTETDTSIIYNYIAVPLSIGTPPQSFEFLLEFHSFAFWLINNDSDNIMPSQKGFYPEKSLTIKVLEESKEFKQRGIQGTVSSDVISIGNESFKDIEFVHAKVFNDLPITSGIIGLDLYTNDENIERTNFIRQLKKKDIIHSYTYSIKYTDDTNGNFIFGEMPEKIDLSLKNKVIKWEKTLIFLSDVHWGLDFDFAYLGTMQLKNEKKLSVIFGIEYGVIIAQPPYYKNILPFFKPLIENKKCDAKIIFFGYISYVCDQDIDLTDFNDLIFKKGDYSFVLTKKDLFKKEGDKLIFLVIFDEDEVEHSSFWIFGTPFLKKYQMVFDQDKKMIGYYIDDNNKNTTSKNSYGFLWWFSIIIGLLFISWLTYFIYLKIKVRRVKLKRLDDIDYDYMNYK